jgi:hypothetical protein
MLKLPVAAAVPIFFKSNLKFKTAPTATEVCVVVKFWSVKSGKLPPVCVTFIAKAHVEILFAASFAVKMTFVVPSGKLAPLAKLLVTVAAPHASVAVGFVQVAVAEVPAVVKFCAAGQPESTGGVTSGAHGLVAPPSERQISSSKMQPAVSFKKPISTNAAPVGAIFVKVACVNVVVALNVKNSVASGVNELFKNLI